jgi:hypothetical protein
MKSIRLKIHDLLDEHSGSLYNCTGCGTCTEIERLGKMLGREQKEPKFPRGKKEEKAVAKITQEEYQDLKAQGLRDREIAHQKLMNPSQLSMLKKKWFEGSNQLLITENPTPKTETTKEDKTAEMRQLINDLSDTNNAKDKLIVELQAKVKELENLNAACSDVENECNSLRSIVAQERKAKEWAQQEYARTQKTLEEKDYDLENLLSKHADVYSSLIKLEKENRALKDLTILYISKA